MYLTGHAVPSTPHLEMALRQLHIYHNDKTGVYHHLTTDRNETPPEPIAELDERTRLNWPQAQAWFEPEQLDTWQQLDTVIERAHATLQYIPAAQYSCRQIDDFGKETGVPIWRPATKWVQVPDYPKFFLRLSEFRTISQAGYARHMPAEHDSVVLEMTTRPLQVEPRYATAFYLFTPEQPDNTGFSWFSSRKLANVHSLGRFKDSPPGVDRLQSDTVARGQDRAVALGVLKETIALLFGPRPRA